MIRCIVKDYPLLNNRVLQDLAKQEEEDKVRLAKRKARLEQIKEERGITEEINSHENNKNFGDPFKPIKHVLVSILTNRVQEIPITVTHYIILKFLLTGRKTL